MKVLGKISINVNLNHDEKISKAQMKLLQNLVDSTMEMIELAAWEMMQRNFSHIPMLLADKINFSVYNNVSTEHIRQHGLNDPISGNFDLNGSDSYRVMDK